MDNIPCYDNPKGMTFKESQDSVWTVVKRLGKGGFSIVYEAVSGDERAALKVSKTKINSARNEVELMLHLRHPNIVRLLSCFTVSEKEFVTCLELCGKTLMSAIENRNRLDEMPTKNYINQLLDSLDYIHSKHLIVHRDVKCQNILFDKSDDNKIKLCDFGFAKKLQYPGEKLRELCGTPNYISPEVLLKEPYSFPVDIWSVGIITFICLFGIAPFETTSFETTYQRIKKITYSMKTEIISKEASDFIRKVLVYEQERPTIKEIKEMPFLSTIVENSVPKFAPPPKPNYGKRFRQFIEKCLEEGKEKKTDHLNISLNQIGEIVEPENTFLREGKEWITSIWVDKKFGAVFKTNQHSEGAFFNDDFVAMVNDHTIQIGKQGKNRQEILKNITEEQKKSNQQFSKYGKVIDYTKSQSQSHLWMQNVGPQSDQMFNENEKEKEKFPFIARCSWNDGCAFRNRNNMIQLIFQNLTLFFHLDKFDFFYMWMNNKLRKIHFLDLKISEKLRKVVKFVRLCFEK